MPSPLAAVERPPDSPTDSLHRAILETLVYADLFDYPLSFEEVVRYLTVPADADAVRAHLNGGTDFVERIGDFYMLPGRGALVGERARRQTIARRKWAAADRHLRRIASLPFVRMVAVSGSLALDNTEEEGDVDLFISTAAGRLWLCRAFVILAVREAALRGVTICPNYFLSQEALALSEGGVFDARELAQMVPVYGTAVYWRMRSYNRWVQDYLPQAAGPPPGPRSEIWLSGRRRAVKRSLERALSGRLGGALEAWEMRRKVLRFAHRARSESGHVLFTPDCCKGHFGDHHEVIGRRFLARLEEYGLTEKVHGD